MKKVSSLKTLKNREGCILVRRGKRIRVINRKCPKYKACQ